MNKELPKIAYFTIPFRLPSLNEVISANRTHKFSGAKMKKQIENDIIPCILKEQLPTATYGCCVEIIFHEDNYKRDIDNVYSSAKFILDAMVKSGLILNDNRKNVLGLKYTLGNHTHKGGVDVVIEYVKDKETQQMIYNLYNKGGD